MSYNIRQNNVDKEDQIISWKNVNTYAVISDDHLQEESIPDIHTSALTVHFEHIKFKVKWMENHFSSTILVSNVCQVHVLFWCMPG